MADTYIYDASGRHIATTSDQPPDYFGCFKTAGGCLLFLFVVSLAIFSISRIYGYFHPPPVVTDKQIIGTWKFVPNNMLIVYAPDHTYTVTKIRTLKPSEQGTWSIIGGHVLKTTENKGTSFSRRIYWVTGDALSISDDFGVHNPLDPLILERAH